MIPVWELRPQDERSAIRACAIGSVSLCAYLWPVLPGSLKGGQWKMRRSAPPAPISLPMWTLDMHTPFSHPARMHKGFTKAIDFVSLTRKSPDRRILASARLASMTNLLKSGKNLLHHTLNRLASPTSVTNTPIDCRPCALRSSAQLQSNMLLKIVKILAYSRHN